MNKLKIAIIFGGCSSEYEISLQSAAAIISHMDKTRYKPILIGITRYGDWYYFKGDIQKIKSDLWYNSSDCIPAIFSPNRSELGIVLFENDKISRIKIDVIFPVLHGKNGEDGTVQGLFELAGIPIVGCGAMSSAICMDKDIAHRLVNAEGIAVPRYYAVDNKTDSKIIFKYAEKIGYPLFIKPAKSGSSFGITKLSSKNDLLDAVKSAFKYDDKVIIEENINGFEIGCAIMGNKKLTVGEIDEIELSEGFFNYNEKYTLQNSTIHIPARIDTDTSIKVKKTAKKIYRILNCCGFARVDMFISDKGKIIFNEVNTIPGFTSHSRFPNMLKAVGMSFEQIIEEVIELAVKK